MVEANMQSGDFRPQNEEMTPVEGKNRGGKRGGNRGGGN